MTNKAILFLRLHLLKILNCSSFSNNSNSSSLKQQQALQLQQQQSLQQQQTGLGGVRWMPSWRSCWPTSRRGSGVSGWAGNFGPTWMPWRARWGLGGSAWSTQGPSSMSTLLTRWSLVKSPASSSPRNGAVKPKNKNVGADNLGLKEGEWGRSLGLEVAIGAPPSLSILKLFSLII